MRSQSINIPLAFVSVLFLYISTGCSVAYEQISLNEDGYFTYQKEELPTETKKGIPALRKELEKLSPTVSSHDADLLAQHAYLYPMVLANEWELTKPPMLHNVLRNNDIRPGGLCTDWTQTLLRHFHSLRLHSFEFYWAVAFEGRPFWEHSTVVVTAKGQSMEKGIILDPWRNSGMLYWIAVSDDPKFPWKLYLDPSGIKKRELHKPLAKK